MVDWFVTVNILGVLIPLLWTVVPSDGVSSIRWGASVPKHGPSQDYWEYLRTTLGTQCCGVHLILRHRRKVSSPYTIVATIRCNVATKTLMVSHYYITPKEPQQTKIGWSRACYSDIHSRSLSHRPHQIDSRTYSGSHSQRLSHGESFRPRSAKGGDTYAHLISSPVIPTP